MSGASGAPYGITIVQSLLSQGFTVHLLVTEAGWRVLKEEQGWDATRRPATLEEHFGGYPGKLKHHPMSDIGAGIASGSFRTEGMVIVPCSMGTLAAVANGLSDNLLERAADVMLKEARPLLLVPRETPLHAVHLENMLKLTQLGARLIPAMPAFYHGPQSLQDMVNFMAGKVLDAMRVEHELYRRWGATEDETT
ncbi:aromatic acid decarboxylase [Paenibacillus swuensis]|uniref:Flavin prenyltransferase UbiX n=1 Tax=Paenibacillus swuensis TaxID=1178515 RepID=A0A172TPX1_9BACL|nr:aromatic acid decarboxylase [Paenibacillus swuensis]